MSATDEKSEPQAVARAPRPVRVRVAIPVRLYDGKQTLAAELQNLSIGGAFVAVEPPIPVGTGLSFWAPLDAGPPLLLRGHVRWTRSLRSPDGEAVGIGIQLFDVEAAVTARLEEWLRLRG